MKRIVQCPKCEAKLAVFDIGKPINQKCPRCGNAFEISSEENAGAPEAAAPATDESGAAEQPKEAAEPTPDKKKTASKGASKKGAAKDKDAAPPATPAEDVKAPAAPAEDVKAPAEPATEAAPATEPEKPAAPGDTEKKEITLKKPLDKPAAARPATPDHAAQEPAPAHGVSFLHVMVIFGLLIMAIVMQVRSAKKAETRFNSLDAQLQALAKQLKAQPKQ